MAPFQLYTAVKKSLVSLWTFKLTRNQFEFSPQLSSTSFVRQTKQSILKKLLSYVGWQVKHSVTSRASYQLKVDEDEVTVVKHAKLIKVLI